MLQPRFTRSAARPDWEFLVAGIRSNNDAVLESFAAVFVSCLRRRSWVVIRNRDEVDDCVGDCLLTVITDIQSGRLRDPNRLPAHVFKILQRTIVAVIANRAKARVCLSGAVANLPGSFRSPEEECLGKEKAAILQRAMGLMRPIDRAIIRRFYFQGQSPEAIMLSLGLNPTQFRLRKSRAKANLAAIASGLQVLPVLEVGPTVKGNLSCRRS